MCNWVNWQVGLIFISKIIFSSNRIYFFFSKQKVDNISSPLKRRYLKDVYELLIFLIVQLYIRSFLSYKSIRWQVLLFLFVFFLEKEDHEAVKVNGWTPLVWYNDIGLATNRKKKNDCICIAKEPKLGENLQRSIKFTYFMKSCKRLSKMIPQIIRLASR